MALVRAIFTVLALGFLLSMLAFNITGDPVWRQRAMLALRWGVVAGMCFFGVLILRRAAVFI